MFRPNRRRLAFTLVELLVVIAIIGVLVALLLPAVQAAREAARRSSCSNNFKQLGIAIHNYHDTLNALPPGVMSTQLNQGLPASAPNPGRMSWMPHLLPFMEQAPLYDKLQPYFSQRTSNNFPRDYMNTTIKTFVCPSDGNSPQNGLTAPAQDPPHDRDDGFIGNYLLCHGSTTLTPASSKDADGIFFYLSKTNLASITDGTSNTVMGSEVLVVPQGNAGRDWRGRYYRADHNSSLFSTLYPPNPKNVPDQCRTCDSGSPPYAPCKNENADLQYISARSRHPAGVNSVMGDGSVRFVTSTINVDTWRALGTRAGAEAVSDF